MSLQNKDYSVEELFAGSRVFRVPQFQRAFGWKVEHLEAFYEDLLNQPSNKPYYYGTLLLEFEGDESDVERYSVVDGQQRLTTLIIFLAQLAEKLEANGKDKSNDILEAFISCKGMRKFYTAKDDDTFFWDYIIRSAQLPSGEQDTLSKDRLVKAATFFRKKLQTSTLDEQMRLLRIVKEAKVIIFCVKDRGEATQIFELQNDRGKRLTQLETVKSFLMHAVYLKDGSPHRQDDVLRNIEDRFGDIYKKCQVIEKLDPGSGGEEREDAILRYHWTAFEQWEGDVKPKELLKKHLTMLRSQQDAMTWIEKFVRELSESFLIYQQLLEKRDAYEELADLYVLGRMASFYPLLLKTFKHDKTQEKSDFKRVAKLLEIFSFRAYGIANVRSNTGFSDFNTRARNFDANFPALIQDLKYACTEWWRVGQRFETNLEGPGFYHEGKDALYLLWKYENHLRTGQGKEFSKIPWRDFLEQDSKSRWTIEHIFAQKAGSDDVERLMVPLELTSEELLQRFRLNYLHYIGNLVIDSHSANASKGKKDVANKESSFSKAPLVSQIELKTKYFGDDTKWDEASIKKRGGCLIEFARRRWDPSSV